MSDDENTCRWAAICTHSGCRTLCDACGYQRGAWEDSAFHLAGAPHSECASCRYVAGAEVYQCDVCESREGMVPSRYEHVGAERRTSWLS